MTIAATLVVVLAAGLAAQLVAARLRIPAIVVLIATGLILGPLSGVVTVPADSAEVSAFIGLGVAVVLFEGAMDLRFGEIERVGKGIRRLTLLGPPIAMILGALAAHYVGGLEWPVAWVLGALLVVTGPTVIIPLLRQANLNKESSSLLKWEGIINDPIGVLLAMLTLQYFLIADAGVGGDLDFISRGLGVASVVVTLVGAIITAVVLGAGVGVLLGIVFRRGWVNAHLKSPLLLVAVLVVSTLADIVVDESGLLAVTLMGIVLGNMNLAEREQLLDFKEGLSVVILSALFIIIPAQLDIEQLLEIDWRIIGFIVVLMFVVRPVTVALVTIRSPLRWQDRVLMGWIAPRGIVAAATAGVLGPELVEAGYEDGAVFLPTVFLVIIVTVLAHGFSLGWLSRRLGLSAGTGRDHPLLRSCPVQARARRGAGHTDRAHADHRRVPDDSLNRTGSRRDTPMAAAPGPPLPARRVHIRFALSGRGPRPGRGQPSRTRAITWAYWSVSTMPGMPKRSPTTVKGTPVAPMAEACACSPRTASA